MKWSVAAFLGSSRLWWGNSWMQYALEIQFISRSVGFLGVVT